jgi:hypothetical protein
MSTRVTRADDDGRGAPFHVSWGALFAGAAAALGVWILLYALGVALGLSNVDPNDRDTMRASGIFTGVWGLAAPLVALFIGGLVAGRSAGALGRGGGALHGLVVWSVTALGGLFLVATLFGNVLGSAVAVGQNVATRAIAGSGTGTAPGDGVVHDVTKAIGKAQAQATKNVERKAIEAAPETGTAFWVVFGALLLGMLAAVAGGAAGVTRGQRRLAEAEVIAGTDVVESAAGRTTIPGVLPTALADAEVDTLRAEIAELRGEIRELIQQNGAPIHH